MHAIQPPNSRISKQIMSDDPPRRRNSRRSRRRDDDKEADPKLQSTSGSSSTSRSNERHFRPPKYIYVVRYHLDGEEVDNVSVEDRSSEVVDRSYEILNELIEAGKQKLQAASKARIAAAVDDAINSIHREQKSARLECHSSDQESSCASSSSSSYNGSDPSNDTEDDIEVSDTQEGNDHKQQQKLSSQKKNRPSKQQKQQRQIHQHRLGGMVSICSILPPILEDDFENDSSTYCSSKLSVGLCDQLSGLSPVNNDNTGDDHVVDEIIPGNNKDDINAKPSQHNAAQHKQQEDWKNAPFGRKDSNDNVLHFDDNHDDSDNVAHERLVKKSPSHKHLANAHTIHTQTAHNQSPTYRRRASVEYEQKKSPKRNDQILSASMPDIEARAAQQNANSAKSGEEISDIKTKSNKSRVSLEPRPTNDKHKTVKSEDGLATELKTNTVHENAKTHPHHTLNRSRSEGLAKSSPDIDRGIIKSKSEKQRRHTFTKSRSSRRHHNNNDEPIVQGNEKSDLHLHKLSKSRRRHHKNTEESDVIDISENASDLHSKSFKLEKSPTKHLPKSILKQHHNYNDTLHDSGNITVRDGANSAREPTQSFKLDDIERSKSKNEDDAQPNSNIPSSMQELLKSLPTQHGKDPAEIIGVLTSAIEFLKAQDGDDSKCLPLKAVHEKIDQDKSDVTSNNQITNHEPKDDEGIIQVHKTPISFARPPLTTYTALTGSSSSLYVSSDGSSTDQRERSRPSLSTYSALLGSNASSLAYPPSEGSNDMKENPRGRTSLSQFDKSDYSDSDSSDLSCRKPAFVSSKRDTTANTQGNGEIDDPDLAKALAESLAAKQLEDTTKDDSDEDLAKALAESLALKRSELDASWNVSMKESDIFDDRKPPSSSTFRMKSLPETTNESLAESDIFRDHKTTFKNNVSSPETSGESIAVPPDHNASCDLEVTHGMISYGKHDKRESGNISASQNNDHSSSESEHNSCSSGHIVNNNDKPSNDDDILATIKPDKKPPKRLLSFGRSKSLQYGNEDHKAGFISKLRNSVTSQHPSIKQLSKSAVVEVNHSSFTLAGQSRLVEDLEEIDTNPSDGPALNRRHTLDERRRSIKPPASSLSRSVVSNRPPETRAASNCRRNSLAASFPNYSLSALGTNDRGEPITWDDLEDAIVLGLHNSLSDIDSAVNRTQSSMQDSIPSIDIDETPIKIKHDSQSANSASTMQSHSSEEDGAWQCSKCTFVNKNLHLVCGACNEKRVSAQSNDSALSEEDNSNRINPVQTKAESELPLAQPRAVAMKSHDAEEKTAWRCNTCTFVNENPLHLVCGACGLPRD